MWVNQSFCVSTEEATRPNCSPPTHPFQQDPATAATADTNTTTSDTAAASAGLPAANPDAPTTAATSVSSLLLFLICYHHVCRHCAICGRDTRETIGAGTTVVPAGFDSGSAPPTRRVSGPPVPPSVRQHCSDHAAGSGTSYCCSGSLHRSADTSGCR